MLRGYGIHLELFRRRKCKQARFSSSGSSYRNLWWDLTTLDSSWVVNHDSSVLTYDYDQLSSLQPDKCFSWCQAKNSAPAEEQVFYSATELRSNDMRWVRIPSEFDSQWYQTEVHKRRIMILFIYFHLNILRTVLPGVIPWPSTKICDWLALSDHLNNRLVPIQVWHLLLSFSKTGGPLADRHQQSENGVVDLEETVTIQWLHDSFV